MRYQNVSLTLAIVADCRRKQGGRNQGSSQLTVWQWLTRVELASYPVSLRGVRRFLSQPLDRKRRTPRKETGYEASVERKLTSRTTNSKKKETTRYQQLFKTSGEGRKGTDQSKHSQHFQGPSSTTIDDVGVGDLIMYGRARNWKWTKLRSMNR